MGYPVIRYPGNRDTRQLSADVWGGALEKFASGGPDFGSAYFEDFKDNKFANTTDASSVGGWFIQDLAAGGTSESFAAINGKHGKQRLSAATGTAHFGIRAHLGAAATTGADVLLTAGNKFVFEILADLDSAGGVYFIGLTEAIAEFLSATSGLPTDSDYIGFHYDGTDLKFVVRNDNAGGTASETTITVLTSANIPTGEVNLAFAVNEDQTVAVAVNGARVAQDTLDTISADDIPIELLCPSIDIGRGAGSDTTVQVDIDYIATFLQDFNTIR